MEDPFPPDSRRLVGFPYHRADIGEYRIVYRVDKDTSEWCWWASGRELSRVV
jgi:mRNA-degrading endonuclease RelE of RelBE toxin-antitoxin system